MSYAVVDEHTRLPYVPVLYPTRRQAEAERAALLRHHAAGSEWQARLVVREWGGRVRNDRGLYRRSA